MTEIRSATLVIMVVCILLALVLAAYARLLTVELEERIDKIIEKKGNRRASKVEGKTGHWIDHGSHMTCSQCGEVHVQDSYATYCCVCGSKNR